MKIVEVIWRDSWSSSAKWKAEDMEREPDFILKSVGYLLHSDRRGINIAGEYREQDKFGRQVQHIPRALVLKVREIK